MGHYTGIRFDLTFKADAPQSIIDVFEHLGGLVNMKYSGDDERRFCQLLVKCPEPFPSVVMDPLRGTDRDLFQYVTRSNPEISGWDSRRFDKTTLRFESAGSSKCVETEQVLAILDSLIPFLVLEEGTIAAVDLYERSAQECVYWYHSLKNEFRTSGGMYYTGGELENIYHPNHEDRPHGWALENGFKQPRNFYELKRMRLTESDNKLGYKPKVKV